MVAPLVVAAGISALGSLAGGALGASSGKSAAKMQHKYAMEAAQRQMDFQERMSNTSYQRAAKDLEKAGLNRILALGSGASTPSGAMAQIPDFAGAAIRGRDSGASLGKMATAEARLLAAQTEATLASAKSAESTAAQNAFITNNILPAQAESAMSDSAVKGIEAAKAQLFWQSIQPAAQKAGQAFKTHGTPLASEMIQTLINSAKGGTDLLRIINNNPWLRGELK